MYKESSVVRVLRLEQHIDQLLKAVKPHCSVGLLDKWVRDSLAKVKKDTENSERFQTDIAKMCRDFDGK